MNTFCPFCEQETKINEIKKTEQLNIRDETIEVERILYQCESCGEEFEIADNQYDPYAIAYREYRDRKGWPQPEQIKEFREALGLSQQQFSGLLGIGVATINRYEKGALQSESNNRLITICMNDPWIIKQFAINNSDILSTKNVEELNKRIIDYLDGIPELLSDAIQQYGTYPPGIMSGEIKFNFRKFFEVAKILCHDTAQFTTKLLKLFFYVDFKHYKDYGQSITGMRYARINYGPVPNEYKTWLAALTDWVKILEPEKVDFGDYCGEILSSTSKPNFNLFSLEELNTINYVKNYFKNYSSKEIEDFSHEEEGYKRTQHSKCISYEFAKDLRI